MRAAGSYFSRKWCVSSEIQAAKGSCAVLPEHEATFEALTKEEEYVRTEGVYL